jgi:hypothetical protein
MLATRCLTRHEVTARSANRVARKPTRLSCPLAEAPPERRCLETVRRLLPEVAVTWVLVPGRLGESRECVEVGRSRCGPERVRALQLLDLLRREDRLLGLHPRHGDGGGRARCVAALLREGEQQLLTARHLFRPRLAAGPSCLSSFFCLFSVACCLSVCLSVCTGS